jgi:hypothetical protein
MGERGRDKTKIGSVISTKRDLEMENREKRGTEN